MSDKLSNKTLLEGLFSLLKTESFQEQPKTAPVEQEDCVADEDWHDFLKSNKSRQGRRELDNPWEHMKQSHRRKYKQRSAHKSLRENMDDMMIELDGLVKESSVKKLSNTAKNSIKGAVTTPEANNNAGDAYKSYRFGLAMAGAPEYPTKAESEIGGDPLLTTYTDEEWNMVQYAAKQANVGPLKRLSSNRSVELSDTNKKSAIVPAKRNKYGI